MTNVLIAVTGSLGDLNPMLAIAGELSASCANVKFVTYPCYEEACRRHGFGFAPVGGPDSYVRNLRYSREMLDGESFEMFVDRVNFESLETQYQQMLAAAWDAHVLVAPTHVAPAHLVAEKIGIPYVGCALCLIHLRSTSTLGSDQYRKLAAAASRWNSALRQFRRDHQLARRVLPLASLLSDAARIVGALPSFLVSPQDMRNANLEVVGYPNYHQPGRLFQDAQLLEFCDERTAAFSFGSFADACDPDHFFLESVEACRTLGLKCVYLSQHPTTRMLEMQADDVMVRADVAPGAVFPLAGIAVHHGATGTMLAACTPPRPMVIVPFFLDQPQQAARMHELIGSPVIPAAQYTRHSAADALRRVAEHRDQMIESLGKLMAAESDGARRAADQILQVARDRKTARSAGALA